MFVLLMEVADDGIVTRAEATKLMAWLVARRDANIDGAAYLLDVLADAFADGILRASEKEEILAAIKKMLPDDLRRDLDVEAASDRLTTKPDSATERQIAFLLALGCTGINGLSKAQASQRITERMSDATSPRQLMVLKFFGHESLAPSGKRAVSRWMDSFYAADENRKLAWEAWKASNALDGNAEVLSNVPTNGDSRARILKRSRSALSVRFVSAVSRTIWALLVPGTAQMANAHYSSARVYFLAWCCVIIAWCTSVISVAVAVKIVAVITAASAFDGLLLNDFCTRLLGRLFARESKIVTPSAPTALPRRADRPAAHSPTLLPLCSEWTAARRKSADVAQDDDNLTKNNDSP